MERFGKNETEAVAIYQEIGSKSRFWLYEEIDATAIPRWQENIQITERIAKIEGLPAAYAEMNTSFGKYASYRLEEAILLSKSYKEDTDKYNAELEEINRKIIDNLGVQNFY